MDWLKRLPQAPVTSVLLGLNVLVYVLMAALGHHTFAFDPKTLISGGANVVLPPGQLPHPSVFRLLTATFVHNNLIHIAMNMLFLVQIGVLSERFVGSGVIAFGYVFAGIVGNVASTLWARTQGVPWLSAGASGSLMGLLGLVAVVAWFANVRPLAMLLLRNAGFIVVLGLGLSLSGHGFLDNGAHIGGLLAGAGLGWVRVKKIPRLPPALNTTLLVVSFALVALAFAVVIPARGTR